MNEQFKAQITYKSREFATAYTNRHFPNEPAFAFGHEGWEKFVIAMVELAGAHPDKGTSALSAPVVPAPEARDEWRELFWSVARALNCLPSTYVDGNAHVYKQAEKYAAIATAAPVAQLSEPPEGWVLVPIAPTIEMCEAGREAELFAPSARSSLVVYRAMLAAAPTTPKDAS